MPARWALSHAAAEDGQAQDAVLHLSIRWAISGRTHTAVAANFACLPPIKSSTSSVSIYRPRPTMRREPSAATGFPLSSSHSFFSPAFPKRLLFAGKSKIDRLIQFNAEHDCRPTTRLQCDPKPDLLPNVGRKTVIQLTPSKRRFTLGQKPKEQKHYD